MFRFCKTIFIFILDSLFPPTESEKLLCTVTINTLTELISVYIHDDIYALLPYSHPIVRHGVLSIKENRHHYFYKHFAHLLAQHIAANITTNSTNQQHMCLVPIPASQERKKKHGFNQCLVLVQHVRHRLRRQHIPSSISLVLHLSKETQKQSMLTKRERARNRSGIFYAQQLDPHTQYILIDDVTTTGSTMRAAREALLQAGAVDVFCYTVAYTPLYSKNTQ